MDTVARERGSQLKKQKICSRVLENVPSDLLKRLENVSVGNEILIDDSSKDSRENGVEDDVGAVKESHDCSKGRDVLVTFELHVGKRGLNVSCRTKRSSLVDENFIA